jgi:hypothetical protein
MDKLVREVGPWVDKERFWNREKELADLISPGLVESTI